MGLSLDILEGECLYGSPVLAVEIIARDIETDHLRDAIEAQYQRVIQNHRSRAVTPLFRRLYAEIEQIPPLAVAALWSGRGGGESGRCCTAWRADPRQS